MSNTINNVNEVQVINNHGELVVSSRKVAEDFGKDHAKVLRNIEKQLKELSAPKTLDGLFTIDNIYMIVSKLKEEHDGLMAKIATKDSIIAGQNVTIKNLEAQVKNTMLLPETLEVVRLL